MEKYEVYKSMNENLTKAMRSGFYYQAIFIEYAIIEDRCTSALKYAGVKYLDRKGRDISISQKLKEMRNNTAFQVPYIRQRITLELTMFKFEQILVPVYIRQQMEVLAAENAELRQQVAEQADALIELAGMYEEATNNG